MLSSALQAHKHLNKVRTTGEVHALDRFRVPILNFTGKLIHFSHPFSEIKPSALEGKDANTPAGE